MPRPFTFLNALAGEIDKLSFEIEEEAKDIVTKELEAVRERKKVVFDKARDHVAANRLAVEGLHQNLEKLETALDRSNSGDTKKNPT